MRFRDERLDTTDNRGRSLAGGHVVAAGVIDDDARTVRQDDLVHVVQDFPRAGAAEGAVEHRQRRHVLLDVGPLSENAAADEEDGLFGRRGGAILIEENFDLVGETHLLTGRRAVAGLRERRGRYEEDEDRY